VNVEPNSAQQPEHPMADPAPLAPLLPPAETLPVESPPAEFVPPTPMEAGAPALTPLQHPVVPPQSEGARLDHDAGDEATEEAVEEDESAQEEERADEPRGSSEPLEFIDESVADADLKFDWFILKVQVNREDSIKDALLRRVKMNALDRYFKDIVVPTEDIAEFTKTGKRRVVKKKLYPGYILINMAVNDDSWFMVRETPGIGDFTGSAGKPTPMDPKDVERILRSSKVLADEVDPNVKTAIPFAKADRVRVKEGYFQNFEGDVDAIDQANGRVTVMINIFGRSTPVELEHWQIEKV
jgi:transcriptional antiterminator NusG